MIKKKLPLAILQFMTKNAIKNSVSRAPTNKSRTGKLLSKWGLSKKLN